MRFSDLLSAAEISVGQRRGDAEVTEVQIDSRRCRAGSCFIAVRGWSDDGHKYIRSAAAAGTSAVVCEDPNGVPASLPFAVVDHTQEAAGRLAQAAHGWPVRRLVNVAVTGTNGKTTVAHLLRAVLRAAGMRPAMLGTIQYDTTRRSVPAVTTTPDPVHLADMTREMADSGTTHLVMEVSSHALDQRRTAGIDFRVGVFTNLTGDHLDYHGTMAAYLEAKRRLFEQLGADAVAAINRDDPAGEVVAAATPASVIWYGLSPLADLRARIEQIDSSGSRFTLLHGDRSVPARTGLIGRHNVFNLLAAAAAGLALGIDLETIAKGLESVARVPGRLERVRADAPYSVFVDYAHTDDALSNVLSALRPVTSGKVIVVFGCGGDRDRTKRPRMARVAEELADHIVITSDNPRTEDPQAIIEEICSGLGEQGRARARVEPDRRAAIELGIRAAAPGDVVLIAGKGHETYQVIGTDRVHFDDAEVASEWIAAREGPR